MPTSASSRRSANTIRRGRASSSPSRSTKGAQYRVGTVDVHVERARDRPGVAARAGCKLSAGDVYNAEAVEKTRRGHDHRGGQARLRLRQVRPRGDRDFADAHRSTSSSCVEEGPRAYIERINIRGNTRTRDYVIRREFDIGEGDAYNRALIDRAERRLKNLDYFKTVKITNEPGSAPDRVIVNVDVEEQSTGEFSVSGGYSTADGFIAEVSVAERNLLGRGQYAKASVQLRPVHARLRIVVRRAVFARLPPGRRHRPVREAERSRRATCPTTRKTIGGNLRLGFALTRGTRVAAALFDLSAEDHAAGSVQQLQQLSTRTSSTAFPTPTNAGYAARSGVNRLPDDCYADGEASLRGAQGAGRRARCSCRWSATRSTYNTLDNNKNPTSGLYAEFKQDFAGVGGDVNFIRTTGDVRNYYEVLPGRRRRAASSRAATSPAGAARTCACSITSRWARTWCAASRPPASVRAT